MLMPGQGLRDSRDSRDRGLGPGLTQQGLGDSRDRDLGPGSSLNRGSRLGDSGTHATGLGPRANGTGARDQIKKIVFLCFYQWDVPYLH